MANPRIEEVSDEASDPEEMDVEDLDAFDFARPGQNTLQSSAIDPSGSQIDPQTLQSLLQQQNQPQQPQISDRDRARMEREQRERSKHFQCLYPIYFDSSRSRQDGRRVRKEEGVENPLARTIVDALQHIGQEKSVAWNVVFEPMKTHPKDWANPGRVRVQLKEEGRSTSSKVRNKHALYHLISSYLNSHPTTPDAPMRLRLQGLPMPKDGKPPVPAIPRGFKMGSVLPLHSPAVSGGGVSDNFLKDMMSEMGGQLPPGMEGMMNAMGPGGAGGGKGGKPKMVRVRK